MGSRGADASWRSGLSLTFTSARALLPPAHLVQADGIIEAAENGIAPVREQEPLAGDKLPHHVRRQDLPARRLPGDAGGGDDRRAEQALLLCYRLPSVEADADADSPR